MPFSNMNNRGINESNVANELKSFFSNHWKKIIGGFFGAIIFLVLLLNSVFTTQEGTVDIIKRFGKAIDYVKPGLHFKIPFVETTQSIETRIRKNTEQMNASTSEQMPSIAVFSVNWTVDPDAVLELYIKYGSLNQFETRVLDPKFISECKNAVSKFTAEENINNRNRVASLAIANLKTAMKIFPIQINGLQYENIVLPKKYRESISVKQTAKNERDAEKFRLEKQALIAQREVNIAKAKKESTMAIADGNSYKIKKMAQAEAEKISLIAKAEADAIKIKSLALKNNNQYIEFTKAKNWKGDVPNTVVTDGAGKQFLMSIK